MTNIDDDVTFTFQSYFEIAPSPSNSSSNEENENGLSYENRLTSCN